MTEDRTIRWCRWTSEMDGFLIENFEWIGDTHLSDMFAKRFPKPYPWTKKHIEKRRSYLRLKRTSEQENILRIINNWDGRHSKAWNTRGRNPEGTIKVWKGRRYIKVNNRFTLHDRHIAGAKPGQIARSYEGKLRIISQAENAILNNKMRAALPPELKRTIKALNQLKKIIHGKENRRLA